MSFPSVITRFDFRFYEMLRQHRLSPKGERLLKLYARLGDGWFWGAVLLSLFLTHNKEELLRTLLPVLSATTFSLILYWGIKLVIRRPRPFELLGGEAEVPPLDRFSFPSGHTMNNLSVALALTYFFPVIGGVAIAVPLSWGVLRIYFGVHYLSDIIAGVLLAIPAAAGGLWFAHAVAWL